MPATPRPVLGLSKGASALILCGLTILLLTLSFPSFLRIRIWPLAFFAVAPMAMCIVHRPLKWRWLGLYYLTGFAYFAANFFWMWPVTVWGTCVLSLYVALYFVL